MSSGLMMSCVRENSPPLELDISHSSGPFSLPEANMSSTGGAKTQLPTFPTHSADGKQATLAPSSATITEQKRRRFHPLRNLRRIFRRRTITSPADTPNVCLPKPTSSTSEKNLRSSTLSSITSVVSASSPSSPLTHQQLQDSYLSQSLPKSKSAYSTRAEKYSRTPVQCDASIDGSYRGRAKIYDHSEQDAMYTTTSTTSSYHHHQQQQRQTFGVAVLPMGRNFFAERQKLRSVDGSSQDMAKDNGGQNDDCSKGANNSEMSDSQRSLSEGRLVESDFSQDPLSHSHDSVFSESATASSLSIVLKAELADVLRKRRNRPDASDEDLGLPRSPNSPQRHAEHYRAQNHTVNTSTGNGNYSSEISSISWVSTSSTDCDDLTGTSTSNNSSAVTTDIFRHSLAGFSSFNDSSTDEVDLFSTNWQRLSHNAAKHKMAIRPTKKKGPSRHQRRTLETSIPEANEDSLKFASHNLDSVDTSSRAKTRSLPPGIDAKSLEQHIATENYATATKRTTKEESKTIISTKMESKTEKSTSLRTTSTTHISSTPISESLRNFSTKAASIFEPKHNDKTDKPQLTTNETKEQLMETAESGFLRRLITRNSKRTIAKANEDQDTADETASEPKKLQMSTSLMEEASTTTLVAPKSRKEPIEDTHKDIKGKTGLTAMLSNFLVHEKHEDKHAPPKPVKPKSGPAARQRFLPQEIAQEQNMPEQPSFDLGQQRDLSMSSVLSKCNELETFESTKLIRRINSSQTLSPIKSDHLYERKPKIVGLSAFQQKISRSNDSVIRSTSTDSLEEEEEELQLSNEQKQRKLVEKSRSFRTYTEDQREVQPVVHNNMPSMPDLSTNLRVPACFTSFMLNDYTLQSPTDAGDKSVSLGFEINDNNLMKPSAVRNASTGHLPGHTSSMILTTKTDSPTKLMAPVNVVQRLSPSNSCNKNISEIEQNIDWIVKSPVVSVVRRSTNFEELNDAATKPIHEPTTIKITHEEPSNVGSSKTKDKVLVKEVKIKPVAERPNVLNLSGKLAAEQKASEIVGRAEKPSPTRSVRARDEDKASPTRSKVGGGAEKASPVQYRKAVFEEKSREKQGKCFIEEKGRAQQSTAVFEEKSRESFEGQNREKEGKSVFGEKTSPTQQLKSVFEEKSSEKHSKTVFAEKSREKLDKPVFEDKGREKVGKAVFEEKSRENIEVKSSDKQSKAVFKEKTSPTQQTKTIFEVKVSSTQQHKTDSEDKHSPTQQTKAVFEAKTSSSKQEKTVFEHKTSPTQQSSPTQQTKAACDEKNNSPQKSKNTPDKQSNPTAMNKNVEGPFKSPTKMIFTRPLPRPNVLDLNKKASTANSSTKTSTDKGLVSPALVAAKSPVKSNQSSLESLGASKANTPIFSPTASVALREKSKLTSNAIRHSVELLETREYVDRKSAPANIANGSPAKSRPTSRRSSCMMEQEPQAAADPVKVPEFLKIQLNRIDPARSAKTNVVLAKNVKEPEKPQPNEDVSTHRFSNESLDIIEKPASPETEMRNLASPKSPKSPSKVFSLAPAESVVLREKPPHSAHTNAELVAANKLSVEERKRLFMTEDKLKTDKRIEEIRSVRKKSINEEVYRKCYVKTEESAKEPQDTPAIVSPTATPNKEPTASRAQQCPPAGSPIQSAAKLILAADIAPESTVVLRKKSLAGGVPTKVSDSTPELMKVFARRSLKIKDEDLQALVEKVLPQNNNNNNSGPNNATSKKHTPAPQQQNVDSDKENQSASDEKLDQLDKLEKAAKTGTEPTNNGSQTTNGNVEPSSKRNSMSDSRHSNSSKNGTADSITTNGSFVTNNNNNSMANKKVFTSPLKKCGFRNPSLGDCNGESPVPARERHDSLGSHNNNNNNNSNGRTTTLERQSLNINIMNSNVSKTIERSATVGEFKGIHQRRAEWEQRVKEALK